MIDDCPNCKSSDTHPTGSRVDQENYFWEEHECVCGNVFWKIYGRVGDSKVFIRTIRREIKVTDIERVDQPKGAIK